jgi:hypothetical protein
LLECLSFSQIQTFSQENRNHDHLAVDPGVNNTVEPRVKLPPQYNSVMSNFDCQPHHLFHESLSKDQPSYSNGATCAFSMSNLDLEHCPLDQPSSGDRLPKTDNITNASHLCSADSVICQKDTEKLRQKEIGVMDTETIMHTPRSVVQQLEVPQGSISSLCSKRQKLFSATPITNFKTACQEASSLSVEFVKHDQRIAALESLLKFKLQESPSASQLPLIERNELGIKANDIFRNAEVHAPASSVSCNSVQRRQLEKTSESSTPATPPGQGLNEATNVQSMSCDVLNLDNQLNHECNSHLNLDGGGRKRSVRDGDHVVHEKPEETCKQSRDNDSGQSVNVDWSKVKVTSKLYYGFSAFTRRCLRKGSPGAAVVMGSSPENNLLQKCREMLRT